MSLIELLGAVLLGVGSALILYTVWRADIQEREQKTPVDIPREDSLIRRAA